MIRIGDKVIFGTFGKKIQGTVRRIGSHKVDVHQDKPWGPSDLYPVGTVWTVPMNKVEVVSPTKNKGAEKGYQRGDDRPKDFINIGDGTLFVGPSLKHRGKNYASLWTTKHQTGDIEIELDSTGLHDATIEALEVLHGAAEIFLYGDLEDFAPSISEKHARSKFVKQTAEWAYNNAKAIERLLNAQPEIP